MLPACHRCCQDDTQMRLELDKYRHSAQSIKCPECSRSVVLLTVSQACQILSVSRRSVYRWIDEGRVTVFRSATAGVRLCLSSLFVPARARLGKKNSEP